MRESSNSDGGTFVNSIFGNNVTAWVLPASLLHGYAEFIEVSSMKRISSHTSSLKALKRAA
jgi:hypothetical protein